MKRNRILGSLVVVVLATALMAHASDGIETQPVKEDIAPTEALMLDNNNYFACNLFRAVYEQKRGTGSFVVSPISVAYLLGMLGEGANDETRQQITEVLGLYGSVQDINEHFKTLMEQASRVDTSVAIKIANRIDVNPAFTFIPQYKADMQKYYHAQCGVLDFNDGNYLIKINDWCKEQTDGMIPEILDQIDPSVVMFLLNAVYFKASWTKKFDPNETRNGRFTMQDGTTVKLKMMHRQAQFAYGCNDLYEMLRMPYGNKAYSMYVLLPREGKTVGDVIHSLTPQGLEEQRKNEMQMHTVDVLMPSFTTSTETLLNDVLSVMGMPRAFSYRFAEFRNMVNEDDLYVSMMKQRAKIEVNEDGTKAAAVTIAAMKDRSAMVSSQFIAFHATRPFVYCLIEESTGTIYFMGTYCGEEVGSKDDHPVETKEYVYRSVEQMPRFPGGEAALMKYVKSHIHYPPQANGVQGHVVVQFVVDKTGKVGEVKVVHSLDKYLDNEAVRICKSLPRFTPGRQKGQAVPVWYTLPITFWPPKNN